ncbi:histidine phosphatase family protein [Patescibacteria group bacterium]|nr:histidine phosphatase family protein [Patescibacteria group bacterium]
MGKINRVENKPTTIFFLRHGEPDNPKKLIKGTADFKLTKKGRGQIEKQAKRLLGERIGGLFSSPVLRCLQTTVIVADILNEDRVELDKTGKLVGSGGLRVRPVNELTEWTSSLDGQPQSVVKRLGEEKYNAAFEPREKVVRRMKAFIEKVLTKYPGQTVVAVSHQGPIDLLLMSLEGKDISRTPFNGLTTQKGEMIKVRLEVQGKLGLVEHFRP